MKKSIAIIILVITNLASLVYAFAQATIAEQAVQESLQQTEFAMMQKEIAIANADSARLQAERARLAEMMASTAMEQKLEAEDKLKKCK